MEEICGNPGKREPPLMLGDCPPQGGRGLEGGLVRGEGDAGSRPSIWILFPVELSDWLQERLRKERITDFDTWHLSARRALPSSKHFRSHDLTPSKPATYTEQPTPFTQQREVRCGGGCGSPSHQLVSVRAGLEPGSFWLQR